MRQVTHALLTRPPLTFQSLGFMKSPFDLHVLGTPPAFILSQDQTLMFNLLNCKINVWLIFTVLLFVLGFCSSEFSSQDLPLSCFVNGIFRVALLFICQGTLLCCFLVRCSLFILSCSFSIVKHFFLFFSFVFFE